MSRRPGLSIIKTGGGGGGGTGDVTGPASSTDNAVARFAGTGGKTLKNSTVTINDAGVVSGVATPSAGTDATNKTYVDTGDAANAAALSAHTGNTSNPHATTAAQVGAPPTSRNLVAGAGLTGGGTLASDRVFDIVAANATIVVNTDSIQVGQVPSTQITTSINNQTGTTYTFVLADGNNIVTGNNAADQTFTIPANATVAYPVGTIISVFQLGAGRISFAITSDTLNNPGLIVRTRQQYSCVALTKLTTTMWVISGDLG